MKLFRILITTTIAGILFLSIGLTGCKRQSTPRTATEQQIDQRITEQVKTALGNSPAFKFPGVQVASYKGKVQLSGFVVSDDQKRSAEEIAKTVSGVVAVDNSISLKN